MCQQDTAVIRRPKLGALSVHSPPLSVNPRIVKIGSKDPSMRRRQYRLPGGACIHIIPADRSIRPRYFAFLHQQFLSQCNEQGHSQSGKRRLQRNNVGCRRFVMAAKNRHHGSNACRRRTGRNHCHHGGDATNAGEVQRQQQQQRKYHQPLYRGNPNSGAF